MAGNRTQVDELVDPVAINQISALKTESKSLREEMILLLETSIKLNATLGGSTAATFEKNLKASDDATSKLIANSNKQIQVEEKKVAAQEAAYNKYLVLLSKQQAERDKADAKEIAAAEKKAAKLQAIAEKANAEALRKANVQFPAGPNGNSSPITSEPANPTAPYQPIITGNEDMAIKATKSTEAIQAENIALAEQTEVLAGLSTAQRANLELLLALQIERTENATELKALNVEDAISGERAIFLTQRQLELKIAIQQTTLALSQQTKQMLAEDTSGAQMQARLDELRIAIGNLSEAELANVEIGGVWLAEAERLDIAIKSLRASTGDATKNVGAYTTATAIADKVSAQFMRQLVRMAAQFLLITVIIGGITWLYEYIKGLDMFTGRLDMNKQSWEAWTAVVKDANKAAGDGLAKLEVLNKAAQDNNLTEKERIAAAEKMKELWPDKLKGLDDEAIMNGKVKKSIDEVTASIEKQALAEAALSRIAVEEGKILDARSEIDKQNYAKVAALRRVKGDISSTGSGDFANNDAQAGETVAQQKQDVLDRVNKANADSKAVIAVAQNNIKVLEDNAGLGALAGAAEGKPKKTGAVKDTANTDLLEFNRIKLEESKKINKAVLDNEDNSYDTRMVALDKYLQDSRALIKNSEAIIDADTSLRVQQRINMKLELANKSKDIDKEAALEKHKLDNDELDRHRKLITDLVNVQKEGQQDQLEDLSQGAIVAAQRLQDNRDKLVNAKNLEYSQGKITEKQYNRDLLAINDEYNIQRLSQELTVQKAILAIQEATRDREIATATARGATPEELATIKSDAGKGITGTNNKIASISGQLSNAKSKQSIDETKDPKDAAAEKRKQLQDALGDAKELISDVASLTDGIYDAQISKLQKIGEKINENAEIEKAAVNRSLDTQTNKARAMAIIDAETASKQKAIQTQIAEEKTKQARADKIAAIAEIILNTAIGVSKTVGELGVFGIPTSSLVIALGALQLAKVAATPIPQFAKGTGTGAHRGGLAIIGEKGIEGVHEPGKPTYYSPGVATLVNLPRGTKITPNHMLPETPKWTQTRTDNSDVVGALGRVEKAVSKQQQSKPGKYSGWLREQRQSEAWANYSQNHFR